ncbi:MAG: hypothetical protein ABIP66_20785 [Gemmatimonadaceae bacterium]
MTPDLPDLKPITREGIAAALRKAHRYRLLNDSVAAESICLDVLAVEAGNVEAIVAHVLSITDQFGAGHSGDLARAEAAAAALEDRYANAYYRGIICERWAKSIVMRHLPRSGEMAFAWIEKALRWYEQAEALRSPSNDEAILRWNSCVRMLQRDPNLREREKEAYVPDLVE